MSEQSSYMFVTGPKVTKSVTGEDISIEDLGGARIHTTRSGVAQFVVEDEEEGLLLIRKLLSYLPQNNMEDPPLSDCDDPIDRLEDDLNILIPENPSHAYNVRDVIYKIVDNEEFLEVHSNYAKNIVVGFAKMGGISVGIVANQPNFLAGVLDINASRKAARFVRFCDAFNISLLTLVDVPGFLPGSSQEYGGIIVHGAKLMFAYGEATVPKVTVTLRKSYGGAHCVMSSKQLHGDINYAWPSAEIAVMGPQGAIEVLEGRKIVEIEDEGDKADYIAAKEKEYREKFANPYEAARYGYLDDVIEPRNTRFRVIRALRTIATKKDPGPMKKHSNIPL
jgi:acetyl-CoA carboxylase carboxyltransferase component